MADTFDIFENCIVTVIFLVYEDVMCTEREERHLREAAAAAAARRWWQEMRVL